MKNVQIDLSEFSLEEILNAIKKICENHDGLYVKRPDQKEQLNQKEIFNLLSSFLK